jgi:WD40 repeat protein
VNSRPGDGARPVQVQTGADGTYSVDARGGMGVQVGEGNTQIIYTYNNLTWTDGVAPPPLVSVSGVIDSPYRGLGAFEEQDAAFFFGRETAITELLGRMSRLMQGPGLLVVSGVSGAGKSSLLQAGVLPAIRGGRLAAVPGSASWPCLVFTPGRSPLDELALRVGLLAGADAAAVRRGLDADPDGFALTARQAALAPSSGPGRDPDGPAAGRGQPRRLLLVVDQFEQVFTQCADEEQRRAFITALGAAAGIERGPDHIPAALVVLGVRADFEARCADHPQLAGPVQDRYLVTAMTERQLRLAITEPAKTAGSQVDEDLVEVRLGDLRTRQPVVVSTGVLPLLSHALDQAWRSRTGQALTLADYERTGGIEGAVADSAQRAYDRLSPGQQAAARQIFLRLTATSSDGMDTADRATTAELAHGKSPAEAADVTAALEAFAAERLLTLAADSVEVSHEVLLTAWPLLRDTWLAETHADRIVRTRLRTVAGEWARDSRDPSYLYSGSLLEAAAGTAARVETDTRHAPLNQAEADFLHASRRASRRRARARQQLIAVLAALVVALSTVWIMAVRARNATASQRDLAAARLLISESEAAGSTNATVSDIQSIAAWTLDPSPQSNAALLAAAANPETATITASDDTGVDSLAFSPDGKILATGGGSPSGYCTGGGPVQLWDVATRRQLGKPLNATLVLGFNPDGKTLATCTGDAVQLWNVATGRQIGKIVITEPGHTLTFTLSPDGKTLAIGNGPGSGSVLRLWDVATRQPIGAPTDALASGYVLAFSPDGKTLVTENDKGVLRLWRVTAGHQFLPGPVLTGPGKTAFIYSLAFSPNSRTIATGEGDESADNDDTVQLWNVATGRRIGKPLTNSMLGDQALAFSPDGTTLAAGGADGTLRVWNTTDGQQIAGPFGSGGTVETMTFSPDGKTLVTGNADGTVRLWDMASATFRQIGSGSPIGRFPITWAAFTPGGKSLITLTGNGTVQVWNMANRHQIAEKAFSVSASLGLGQLLPGAVALSPDGRWLVTGAAVLIVDHRQSHQTGVAEVWDVATGQLAGYVLPAGANVSQVAFTSDGERLVTLATSGGVDQGTVQVWSMANGQQIGNPRLFRGETLTADGTILTVNALGPVRRWDPVTGRQAGKPIAVHPGLISWLALSPDGKTLAVGSPNGAAQLWNVTTGQLISSMSGGSGITSARFSSDGAVLATFAESGGGNGPVQLWDVASGQPIGGPVGGSSSSAAAAFSPDGRTLAIVSDDGAVQLWNVSYLTDPLAQLCARIGGSITPAEWAQHVPAGPAYRNGCS